MDMTMRSQADRIISASIRAVQPDDAVARALKGVCFPGRVVLVAAGKAAWQMAKAARDCLGDRIDGVKDVMKINTVTLRFNPDTRLLEVMNVKKPERQKGKVILYKLEGNKIVPIYAEVGLSDLAQIEIKSNDLKEGDQLLSNSILTTINKPKK